MRTIVITFTALIVVVLFGCSMPSRVTIVNNSEGTFAIEFKDGKKKIIAPGQSAEFAFTSFFTDASITHNGAKCVFRWRFPPRNLMDSKLYPPKFTLCLEADGKIYAADATSGDGGRKPVLPQPEGFPLTSDMHDKEPIQSVQTTAMMHPPSVTSLAPLADF